MRNRAVGGSLGEQAFFDNDALGARPESSVTQPQGISGSVQATDGITRALNSSAGTNVR